MHRSVCSRGDAAHRAVWADFVVLLAPLSNDLSGLCQGREPVLVEAFIPGLAIDVSTQRFLHRLGC